MIEDGFESHVHNKRKPPTPTDFCPCRKSAMYLWEARRDGSNRTQLPKGPRKHELCQQLNISPRSWHQWWLWWLLACGMSKKKSSRRLKHIQCILTTCLTNDITGHTKCPVVILVSCFLLVALSLACHILCKLAGRQGISNWGHCSGMVIFQCHVSC